MEIQDREASRLRRAAVETVTESERSSRDAIIEDVHTVSPDGSALDSDGSDFGFDESVLSSDALDSRTSDETERPTSAWRDEWAIREEGIYYS